MNNQFELSAEELERIVAIRRDLHAHPELGFEEFRTSEHIIAELGQISGVEIICRVAKTGVVARIPSSRPGAVIALRADIDALPIEEQSGAPWSSQHHGRMHACGHDGHTAALLGAARVLARHSATLPGPVVLLFQPAEEALGGAKRVMEEGVLQRLGVEAIFGAHSWPGLPKGFVATSTGVLMAASTGFSLTVQGRSCHASQPHRGADPVLAASQFVASVAQLRSRLVDPCEPAVISVGSFHAGSRGSVIPDEARILGTIRTIRSETLVTLKSHLGMLARGIAESVDCEADFLVSDGYPMVRNTPSEGRFIASIATKVVGDDRTIRENPVVLAGEDFSFYLQEIPGAFWFIGAGEDTPPLHNSGFDFCDDLLGSIVAMHVACVKERNTGQ